jgi:hypothetical protein
MRRVSSVASGYNSFDPSVLVINCVCRGQGETLAHWLYLAVSLS